MRFLVDECTGPKVARWLREQNHDVLSVFDDARGLDDQQIIELAFNENRIIITNDKDFGDLIFREFHSHCGVILLRLDNERFVNKIEVIRRLLDNFAEKLPNQFIVVSESQVRFARIDLNS